MVTIKLNYKALLYLSFIPLLMHSIRYLIIGSYIPLIFTLAITIFFLISLKSVRYSRFFAKCWSILLIIYAIIRIGMYFLKYMASSGMPSDIYHGLNSQFLLFSVLYLVFGIWLLVNRRYYFS
jgi:hypothetical protein